MTVYDDARDGLSDLIDFATHLRSALGLLERAAREADEDRCYGRSSTDYSPPMSLAHDPKPGEVDEEPAVVTNDPTHAAADRRDAGVVRLESAARRVFTETGRARHDLTNAVDAVKAALVRPEPPKGAIDAATPEDGLCTNCLKGGARSPRALKATVCAWCRDFKSEHVGVDGKHVYPPASLVDRHARGWKLGTTDLATAGVRRLAEREAGAA